MRPQARIAAFGVCLLLLAAGVLCAVLVGGVLGDLLAFALISIGLVFATSLAFLEVGMSEDRDRARDAAQAAAEPPRAGTTLPRARPRFTRLRSHRRGLN